MAEEFNVNVNVNVNMNMNGNISAGHLQQPHQLPPQFPPQLQPQTATIFNNGSNPSNPAYLEQIPTSMPSILINLDNLSTTFAAQEKRTIDGSTPISATTTTTAEAVSKSKSLYESESMEEDLLCQTALNPNLGYTNFEEREGFREHQLNFNSPFRRGRSLSDQMGEDNDRRTFIEAEDQIGSIEEETAEALLEHRNQCKHRFGHYFSPEPPALHSTGNTNLADPRFLSSHQGYLGRHSRHLGHPLRREGPLVTASLSPSPSPLPPRPGFSHFGNQKSPTSSSGGMKLRFTPGKSGGSGSGNSSLGVSPNNSSAFGTAHLRSHSLSTPEPSSPHFGTNLNNFSFTFKANNPGLNDGEEGENLPAPFTPTRFNLQTLSQGGSAGNHGFYSQTRLPSEARSHYRSHSHSHSYPHHYRSHAQSPTNSPSITPSLSPASSPSLSPSPSPTQSHALHPVRPFPSPPSSNSDASAASSFSAAARNTLLVSAKSGQMGGTEEDQVAESIHGSRDALICTDPAILATGQEFSERFKAIKTDEGRKFVLQSILAACQIPHLQFVSNLIRPLLLKDFIAELPTELSTKILGYLDPLSLAHAAMVSKRWRIVVSDQTIWRNLAERYHFGPHVWQLSPDFSWKEFFKSKYKIYLNWFQGRNSTCYQLPGHVSGVVTCLYFDGNRVITGSDDSTIKVWCVKTKQILRTLKGHTGGVWALQSRDNVLVSGSTDRSLRVWNLDSGLCIHSLHGHTSTVRSLQIKGHLAVSGSRDATLRIWDLITGACLHVLVGHLDSVRCLEIVDNIIVSGSYDCTLMVWDLSTGKCLHKLVGHIDKIYSLAFDGNVVVSGSLDRTIRIWNPTNGQCVRVLEGHRQLVGLLQLRKNILVSGNADRIIKIWNIDTGECVHTLSGHDSAVTCLQFDDTKIVSGSDDGSLKLWDLRTGKFIRNLIDKVEVVWCLQFNDTNLVAAVQREAVTNLDIFDFDPE